MVDKIIFATGNEHKMVEIRMILKDLGAEILSQREAGIRADVVEDGATFEENALIKAKEIAREAGKLPGFENAVAFTLSYIMTLMGVIPVMNGMEIPLGTPVVLSGVLCGGWKLGVWQAVLVLIQVCCYFPFFKVLDNQALKEEREPAE